MGLHPITPCVVEALLGLLSTTRGKNMQNHGIGQGFIGDCPDRFCFFSQLIDLIEINLGLGIRLGQVRLPLLAGP